MKDGLIGKWRRIKEVHFSNFWDTLAWIAFGYVVIYFLLKAAGILNSPFPIDAVAIASGAFFVGKYSRKIDFSGREIYCIKSELKEVSMELHNLNDKIDAHIAKPHH